jgi:hypothetical protein
MEQNSSPGPLGREGRLTTAPSSRRKFLRYTGYTGLAAAVLAGCSKIMPNAKATGTGAGTGTGPVTAGDPSNIVGLGSGDIGLLNYLYALEQLEAAFYTQVIANQYENIPSLELSRLTDIRDHELAHRELLKTWLAALVIPQLTFNFTAVDFSSRIPVLMTAITLEDIVVSAFNGVGSLFTNAEHLLVAGKIVSVEGRHAAYVRNLLDQGLAPISDNYNHGLDTDMSPAQVVAAVQPWITEGLDTSGLPTA